MNIEQKNKYKLCCIKDGFALFSNKDFDEACSGSVWDQKDYDYFSGYKEPFTDTSILKIAFEGPFQTPHSIYHNSHLDIVNSKGELTPCLRSYDKTVTINKDITPEEFISSVELANGRVYLPKHY